MSWPFSRPELHLPPFQGGDLILPILQIDEIPHAVGGGEWIAGLAVEGHDLRLRMGQGRIGLVQHRLMEAVVEAGQIIVKPGKSEIVDGANCPLDGLRAIQHGILPV